MKQGALIYDRESGRYDIRFGLDDYNGGLHCGECFDVFAGGRWKPTRIEMSTGQKWYLVGIKTDVLDGLRVRVHNREPGGCPALPQERRNDSPCRSKSTKRPLLSQSKRRS